MKYILLSAVLLLTEISTYGQTGSPPLQPCTVKLSQAPAVRGVKLGMTVDELLPLFPGISDSSGIQHTLLTAEGYPAFGKASFGIDPSDWPSKERFTGITSYYVGTFDRRITELTVLYQRFPEGPRWKNVDDLIQRFSDSLHLPGPRDWVLDPGSSERKKLTCDGFEVAVTAGEQGSIGFYTRGWEGTKKERFAAFEEQKRREFKP